MNYQASVGDFFKCPEWKKNLLLGAVSILIPMIGPLVLAGWHIKEFWASEDDQDHTLVTPFDFQYLGKYLELALCPFLVALVAAMVFLPILALGIGIPTALIFISNHGRDLTPQPFPIVPFVCVLVAYLVCLGSYQLILFPLSLRATITQDFRVAFDFSFCWKFLSLVWLDLLKSFGFQVLLAMCLLIFSVITCYIGMFFAAPVVMFSWSHLKKQLYLTYLARGGDPVPLSHKLRGVSVLHG
jgi:hypothetical protein